MIVGDIGKDGTGRDIVIEHKQQGLQRITEIHPSFMSLQYPLLFPYGKDGYRPEILKTTGDVTKKAKRKEITMREFYAYILQQRSNGKTTMLFSTRLYHI